MNIDNLNIINYILLNIKYLYSGEHKMYRFCYTYNMYIVLLYICLLEISFSNIPIGYYIIRYFKRSLLNVNMLVY